MKEIWIIFFLILLITSCNKDESPVETGETHDALLPLEVGNYWIYTVGYKSSGQSQVLTERDTLRVVSKSDSGYYLQSRTQVLLVNGYYTNTDDGLYFAGNLDFKYPGNVGSSAGQMNLGDIRNHLGLAPEGEIFKTDYTYRIVKTSGDTINLVNCYYYSLTSFYITEFIKKAGYTIFKPGVGLVLRDWVDIDERTNDFYNPFAILIDYYIQ